MINCFSKFAFAFPLKTKTGKEVVLVLESVLANYPMKHLQTDEGKEWFNKDVGLLLKKYNINHYFTYSDKKASIIERFNRTLKTKMWRMFSIQGNYKWLNLLQPLIHSYNNTVHRTIGVKPNDVSYENEKQILIKIFKNRRKINQKQKFDIGDRVRISRVQKIFTKGYLPRWSNEIFTVWRVQPTVPVTYLLKDDKGHILKGGFYQYEITKTNAGSNYLIEKVLKRKGDKLLVRWLGFDKSHDSWISKKDLQ